MEVQERLKKFDIICECCNGEFEIKTNLKENRFDCPGCKTKKSCYIKWGMNLIIPRNFKAV